jgi:HAD superfamily hydrolase (TIGR01509 family)
MLKLIVFDCDGVMFDSREANIAYYNDLLAAFGFPAMRDDELEFVHMQSVTNSVKHIFRHYPEQDINEVFRRRETLTYTPYLHYMKIEPDLVDFLNFIQARYRLAISTNRTTTMRPLLKQYQLDSYFEKVVTASDVQNPKPAPDALREILSFFDCRASETIYIGDSIVDRQHTKACGVPLIAFKNRDLDAEYHVESFTEVLQLKPFREVPD